MPPRKETEKPRILKIQSLNVSISNGQKGYVACVDISGTTYRDSKTPQVIVELNDFNKPISKSSPGIGEEIGKAITDAIMGAFCTRAELE